MTVEDGSVIEALILKEKPLSDRKFEGWLNSSGTRPSEYSLVKNQSVGGIGSGAIDTQIFRGNEIIAVVQDNTDVLINRDFALFG